MKYLYDTNIIINIFRQKNTPNVDQIYSGVCISHITLAELLTGAYKSTKVNHNRTMVQSFITDFNIEVIPIDLEIIDQYARMRIQLEQQGIRIEDFDLLIASTALVHKLTLVTQNTKHFENIYNLDLISS